MFNEEAYWVGLLYPGYKVNVNGATFANSPSLGVGVIIRDSTGHVTTQIHGT